MVDMLNIPIQFDDLLRIVQQLTPEQKRALQAHLNQSEAATDRIAPSGKRIMGLHRGMITTTEDFDEPLPDEFWLGKDA
jgi:hypothetical protein